MRVLLVEDDEMLGKSVQDGLIQFGYTVDWVTRGEDAQAALLSEGVTFDIVVLDIGLPGKSGLEVLKAVRSKNVATPVVVLTARETIEDRVKGLDAGADDYIVKPFDLAELCARMRALQRRTTSRADPKLTHENIVIDPAAHTVSLNDQDVKISRREFVLLLKLIENAGRVISREHLTSSLYGWGDEIDSNALEVHIHNLRKKFGSNLIRTIRGVGYMVDKPK